MIPIHIYTHKVGVVHAPSRRPGQRVPTFKGPDDPFDVNWMDAEGGGESGTGGEGGGREGGENENIEATGKHV